MVFRLPPSKPHFIGLLRSFPDPSHSRAEERFKAVGRTEEGRHVLIVFTLRTNEGQTFIRPISARFMHVKEINHYEETASKIADR
jgi:hypothetical protein